jgi:hypothetical protein
MGVFYRIVLAQLLLSYCFLYTIPFAEGQALSMRDTFRVNNGEEFYFLRYSQNAEAPVFDTSIYVYSNKDKNTHTLSIVHPDNDTRQKGPVIYLGLNKQNDRLYYSSIELNNRKQSEIVSWYYDISTGKEQLFREGKITGIDKDGVISVLVYASDTKGRYTEVTKYYPDDKYGGSAERIYTMRYK